MIRQYNKNNNNISYNNYILNHLIKRPVKNYLKLHDINGI